MWTLAPSAWPGLYRGSKGVRLFLAAVASWALTLGFVHACHACQVSVVGLDVVLPDSDSPMRVSRGPYADGVGWHFETDYLTATFTEAHKVRCEKMH